MVPGSFVRWKYFGYSSLLVLLWNSKTHNWVSKNLSRRLQGGLVEFDLAFNWLGFGSRVFVLWFQFFWHAPMLLGASLVRGEEEPLVWLVQNIIMGEHASLLACVWWLSILRGRLLLKKLGLSSSSLWLGLSGASEEICRSCLEGVLLGNVKPGGNSSNEIMFIHLGCS